MIPNYPRVNAGRASQVNLVQGQAIDRAATAYSAMACSPQNNDPVAARQIPSSLAGVTAARERIYGLVELLEHRLRPALSPETPHEQDCGLPSRSSGVEVADELNKEVQLIHTASRRIESILERLEL